MTSVRLIDGTDVPSDSERWRFECLERHKHCRQLLAIPTRDGRSAYLAEVQRTEGAEAAARLKARFLIVWNARTAQE